MSGWAGPGACRISGALARCRQWRIAQQPAVRLRAGAQRLAGAKPPHPAASMPRHQRSPLPAHCSTYLQGIHFLYCLDSLLPLTASAEMAARRLQISLRISCHGSTSVPNPRAEALRQRACPWRLRSWTLTFLPRCARLRLRVSAAPEPRAQPAHILQSAHAHWTQPILQSCGRDGKQFVTFTQGAEQQVKDPVGQRLAGATPVAEQERHPWPTQGAASPHWLQ